MTKKLPASFLFISLTCSLIPLSSTLALEPTSGTHPAYESTPETADSTTLGDFETTAFDGAGYAAVGTDDTSYETTTATSTAASGYAINNSVRFNGTDTYLSKTFSAAGNRKTWTWSGWVKLTEYANREIMSAGDSGAGWDQIKIYPGADEIYTSLTNDTGNADQFSTEKLRDYSEWQHLVLAVDTTQATATDRVKLYINGVISSLNGTGGTTTYPAQNAEGWFNDSAYAHVIGGGLNGGTPSWLFDGYMAEVHFIDGQALDASYFGETDARGKWVPKDPGSLTYGTNGFHLDFADNSTANALGTDVSGNGNNWTASGLTTTDQMTDTPTDNYATWNVFDIEIDIDRYTFSEGNLKVDEGSASAGRSTANITFTSGQWYAEATPVDGAVGAAASFGIAAPGYGNQTQVSKNVQYQYAGNITGQVSSSDPEAYAENDVIGVAADVTNNQIRFYKNGTEVTGSPFTFDFAANQSDWGSFTFAVGTEKNQNAWLLNAGQGGTSGLQWCSGAGGYFDTCPPAGFKALSTANLPDPAVTAPSSYFDVVTYTGTGAAQDITSLGFQPDLVWIKNRDQADEHKIVDSVRGVDKELSSDSANAEDDLTAVALDPANTLSSLSNGNLTATRSGSHAITDASAPIPSSGKYAFVLEYVSGGVNEIGIVPSGHSFASNIDVQSQGIGMFAHGSADKVREGGSGGGGQVGDNINWNSAGKQAIVAYDADTGESWWGVESSGSWNWWPGDPASVAGYTLTGSWKNSTPLYFAVSAENGSVTAHFDDALWDAPMPSGFSVLSGTNTMLTSLDANGFTLGSGADGYNDAGEDFVAWTWKEDPAAGFDVVSYIGTGGTPQSINHSLGAVPQFMMVKNRTTGYSWRVYHEALGETKYLLLDGTSTETIDSSQWNNTAPTSTQFSVGTASHTNESGSDFIAYLWAEKEGFSKFGSYTGNSNADGPFVYTGFKPAFVLIKKTNGSEQWKLFDNKRPGYNPNDKWLEASDSGAENSTAGNNAIDLLSNGFKLRSDNGQTNTGEFIYAAFAEEPYQPEPATTGTDGYATQLFTFDLSSITGTINKLSARLLAAATASGGNGVDAKIWNANSTTWEALDSNTDGTMGTTQLSGDITANVSEYIDGNTVRIKVSTKNPSVEGTDAVLSTDWAYLRAWNEVDIGLRYYDGTGVVNVGVEPSGTLTSALRIAKSSTNYGISLVDVDDPYASGIRIKTSSGGVKALLKMN